ncbi:acyl carrier protein [Kribbella sp. NPDC056345]|uniref:acyl carrier protein n=1 Tax=Kribbella sp. NPDC056345 TaxID=3345789 RepID=UPI0035E19ED1
MDKSAVGAADGSESGAVISLRRNWCLLLDVPSADPAQNFFELGGDSLTAVELAARVEAESGAVVPFEVLLTDGDLRVVEAALAEVAAG